MSNAADKYAKMLELNRLRQKRFYEKNKNLISDKRKEKRDEMNRIYKEYKKNKENNNDNNVIQNDDEHVIQNDDNNNNEINEEEKTEPLTTQNEPLTIENVYKIIDNMTFNNSTKQLSPNTKKKYKSCIKQFFNIYDESDLRSAYRSPITIIDLIQTAPFNNKLDVITAILKLLNSGIIPNYPKDDYDILNDYYNELNQENKIKRQNKINNENDKVENIEELHKKIIEKYGRISKENIIFMLYKEIPKRDNFYLKIVEHEKDANDKNINYILVPINKNAPVKVIIYEHKTKGLYESNFEKLSKDLSKIIREYINNNELEVNDYLFPNKKLGSFIKNMFNKIGIDIKGVVDMRKIVVSNLLSNPNTTVEQANQLSRTMKHKISTQQQYKRQVKK